MPTKLQIRQCNPRSARQHWSYLQFNAYGLGNEARQEERFLEQLSSSVCEHGERMWQFHSSSIHRI